ncbi:hypothetical protein EDEG_03432 [Edhazardia aedis USNM 41457]|uniref:Uncharacterized protein n=1 Tax=Edhazardia aedis (strain USNM 41457) TaxID=1003232 RepID=J9D3K0_EDHAE|nr:hypothetical protein EDEG_03432 [Edhazardia aedis USNM 41457]|eukprot:EJW02114.2 hypothetical protein EDEG_03432 [Edhazardia aedis USNM 41457]
MNPLMKKPTNSMEKVVSASTNHRKSYFSADTYIHFNKPFYCNIFIHCLFLRHSTRSTVEDDNFKDLNIIFINVFQFFYIYNHVFFYFVFNIYFQTNNYNFSYITEN